MTKSSTRLAAMYVRVSSAGQEENTSLSTQEADCLQFATTRGYDVAEEHLYHEVVSAEDLYTRPKALALLEAVRNHAVEAVIVWKFDRLARNQIHQAVIVDTCQRAGVKLFSVTEGEFDASALGTFMHLALALAAELELEKLRERVARGKRARLQAGKLPPTSVPLYGYRFADERKERYVADPATAPVVQRIFAEAALGGTARGIARSLNAEGVPTPGGAQQWSQSPISKILRNSAYIGKAYANKTKTIRLQGGGKREIVLPAEAWVPLPDGVVPALVDGQVFAEVEQQLRRNKTQAARNTHNAAAFLLRGGFVRCGHCGRAMAVQSKKGRYYCQKREHSNGSCIWHSHNAKEVDTEAWAAVVGLLTKRQVLKRAIANFQRPAIDIGDLDRVERDLEQVQSRQTRLARAITHLDERDAQPLVTELTALGKEKRRLEDERDAILIRRKQAGSWVQQLTDAQLFCLALAHGLHSLTTEQKRVVLGKLNLQWELFHPTHAPRYVATAAIPLAPVADYNDDAPTSARTGTNCESAAWWRK